MQLLGRIEEDLRQKSENKAAELTDSSPRGFETVDLKQISGEPACVGRVLQRRSYIPQAIIQSDHRRVNGNKYFRNLANSRSLS